jgi:hypothetical protein
MERHKKLDLILKHLSENIGDIPKRPDTILEDSGLVLEKSEAYLIINMLFDDGYLRQAKTKELYNGTYCIKYNGLVFLDNGGYELKHKIYKRKHLSSTVSDYVDIVVKPIGIVTAVLVSIWYIIKLLEFFGAFNSCVN